MAWTDITRPQYERKFGRYTSDCTDEEWALIKPFLPERRKTGRPRTTELRYIWDAIQYMAASGCQWRLIPNDFPPMSTVQGYFYDWRDNGILHQINHALVMAAREAEGRKAQPTAGVIDSQSVKTTESGGICGYDAGKKIKGRKRHIITDTIGFLVGFIIHAANIQDRDGGKAAIALLGNAISTGGILVMLITIFGPISGAHINPAITLLLCTEAQMAVGRTGQIYTTDTGAG